MENLTYTAEFHPEEPEERCAEWVVVKWNAPSANGSRTGSKVRSFGWDEMAAQMYASNLNALAALGID